MLGKSRIAVFFQWSGCSKSRLAKAAGAEVAVQPRNEKWHAAVARSTFAIQNVQNTSGSEQFWKFGSGTIIKMVVPGMLNPS